MEVSDLLGGFTAALTLFTAHRGKAKNGILDFLMHWEVLCAKRTPPTSRNKREKPPNGSHVAQVF